MEKARASQKVVVGEGAGAVIIGGGAQIAIQSMTNTDTANVGATVRQILELVEAGAEMVRVTVPNENAARAVPKIKAELVKRGIFVPLIGDFHYNGHILLAKFPECARALDKYRINPGNVGAGGNAANAKKNFETIIKIAVKNGKPVRLGVNWGSMEGGIGDLVDNVLDFAKEAESFGLARDKIILSVKTSSAVSLIRAYRLLAGKCDYALHLGLTEAGSGMQGLIASAAALSPLLLDGIGDTIRISITPAKGEGRTLEVEACKILLQSLGLRDFSPEVHGCPGCGRTENKVLQKYADEVSNFVKSREKKWLRKNPQAAKLKIAVMGCTVNGPGEAKRSDFALCIPGVGEEKIATVFVQGRLHKTLRGEHILKDFYEILEENI